MSLYVGDNSSGVPVLHITSGTQSASNMKSGELPSTAFLSSVPYLSYNIYNVEAGPYVLLDLDCNQWLRGYRLTYNNGLPIPAGGENTQWIMLDANNNIVTNSSYIWQVGFGSAPSLPGCSSFKYRNYTHYYWGAVSTTGYTHSPSVAVKKIVIFNQLPAYPNGPIVIGNGNITIGGVSLANRKYVFNGGKLNDHPSSITISPMQQLVDASQIAGNLYIVSNSVQTTIYKGSYPIITSLNSFGSVINDVTETLNYQQALSLTFNNGDYFWISYNNYTQLHSFVEGTGYGPEGENVWLPNNGMMIYSYKIKAENGRLVSNAAAAQYSGSTRLSLTSIPITVHVKKYG